MTIAQAIPPHLDGCGDEEEGVDNLDDDQEGLEVDEHWVGEVVGGAGLRLAQEAVVPPHVGQLPVQWPTIRRYLESRNRVST